MTIIEKRYKIKTFEEFSEQEQAEIIERYRYINVEYESCFTDYDKSYSSAIEEKGFINPEIHFDISGCQGSGACFDSDELDFNILLKDFNCKHKQWIINLLNDENNVSIQIKQNHYANHYSHSRTRIIFLFYFIHFNNYKRLKSVLEEARNHIEKVYLKTCDILYKTLQKDCDYFMSDESVKDTLIVNNYYFNEFSYMIEKE